MENESDVLCNDGIYGKALSEYLQFQLEKLGYSVPWVVCEDWGWYVPAELAGFRMALCVYGFPRENDETATAIYAKQGGPPTEPNRQPAGIPLSLCVQVDTQPRKYWDWRRFRRIDRSELVAKLNRDLLTVLQNDSNIKVVRCVDAFPIG